MALKRGVLIETLIIFFYSLMVPPPPKALGYRKESRKVLLSASVEILTKYWGVCYSWSLYSYS